MSDKTGVERVNNKILSDIGWLRNRPYYPIRYLDYLFCELKDVRFKHSFECYAEGLFMERIEYRCC